MRNITMAYLDFLGEIMARCDREVEDRAHNNAEAETYDHDLTAAIRLLECGYDVKDVISVIRDKSPLAKQLLDARAMMVYSGKVIEAVNDNWAERAKGTMWEAKESYLRRLSAQEDDATIQRDCQIGLAMIRQDSFPLPIVRQVFEQHADRREDNAYLSALFSALSDGKERYEAIDTYHAARMESSADVYRSFARAYMEANKRYVLTDMDDVRIVERIYQDYLRRLKRGELSEQIDIEHALRLFEQDVEPSMREGIVIASLLYPASSEDGEARLTKLFSMVKDQILGKTMNIDRSAEEELLADHENIREQEKLSHYVVIPRSDMREDLESEYQYQRKKIEGAIRLPYNITMEVKIVKALLNDGAESRKLTPILSRYKPKDWAQEHPNQPYPSYVLKQIEKEAQEREAMQEKNLVRTRNVLGEI